MMKTPIPVESYKETPLNHAGLHMGLSVREVHTPQPVGLRVTPLVQLFSKVHKVRPAGRGAIIQFVTVTADCNSERLALDMAWASVSTLGKKVLVLNGSKSARPPYLIGASADTRGSETISPVSLKDYLVKVHGLNLYVANLCDAYGGERALVALDDIVGTLRELARDFDMIVIAAPPVDDDPFTTVLAGHVDGNVIVVEADKTRRPTAMRTFQALSSSGATVLGAVLNNQKPYTYGLLA